MFAEKRALLAAIGANPDEDTPRLAFADWCDEHDEPERARFIRLQFEAERYGEHTPERLDIEEQATELFNVHHRKWLTDEPVWARSLQSNPLVFRTVGLYGTRNGFLEHVSLTVADCLANAPEIFATAPVRELEFEEIRDGGRALANMVLPGRVAALTLRFSVTPPHWDSVLASPLLRGPRKLSLDLFGEQPRFGNGGAGITWDEREVLGDDGAMVIARCANLSNLNALALGGGTIGPPGMEALVKSPYLSGLESLSLGGHPVGDEGLIHLSRSPLASRLTKLDLQDTQVGDDGLRAFFTAGPSRLRQLCLGSYGTHRVAGAGLNALVRCDALRALTDLYLDGVPLTPDHVCSLANNPCFAGLRRLHIGASNFDDQMAQELAASPYLRNLRFIDLQNNRVGTRGVSALARSPVLDTVIDLELHNNGGVADAGAAALAGSERVRELQNLGLAATGLGLKGLRAVANSPHLAQLRSLDFESAPFGDRGARALCGSPYLQKIKELTLYNCGISDRMAAALRARFGAAVAL
ncbi:Leucine-rich repeat-containing protein typical subtype OS=Herpetosiphon aurantiacus (strain ATCC 23779 / DSM 785) GN=Haur_4051 PE=4 SV=1: LRR_6: LRR_6: LRR_6 [Gemmata massiliana]|uniref:Repeat-companion domain protein n=1 Tax=Gemmata massiliana TaxID=1210884 RepID=A0A6P2D6Z7_9BACT|nr:TIGR02996 domain-containing protein [Gemmata massiliana]VTR96235.1 Leucine-rich repeat-containing protein typical subtype OS=Herpetosiphon aurantiacus (strain ATCC 23779 / DSM 785) GN=Haur_4051 PE=4 SV=1: LRR_6: LRR_6: LRR_6 [Gemmata massiliana]